MTIAVDLGRKATKQTNKQNNILASICTVAEQAGVSLALPEIPRTYFLATPKSIVITKNNTINHYSGLYKMLSCKNRFHMHKNAINP